MPSNPMSRANYAKFAQSQGLVAQVLAKFAGASWGLASMVLVLSGSAFAADDLPTFRLEVNNGVFNPKTLVVPAGKKFKIEIFNVGSEAIEFESRPLRKEKALNPGGHSFVVIFPLQPGSYPFFDDFHIGAGQGTILVR